MRRHPSRILAVAVVSAALVALGGYSVGQKAMSSQATAPREVSVLSFGPIPLPIEVHAVIARPDYLPSETVEFELTVRNITGVPLTLRSFPPALDVVEPAEGAVVYNFPGGTSPTSLAPGEKASQTFVWNEADAAGKPVPPGHYWLNVPAICVGEMVMGWASGMMWPQQGRSLSIVSRANSPVR